MKLIYAKGTCAFSVHLLLEELGTRYETKIVSLEDKTELEQFNSNGYVPVLELDEGMLMTEATAILQYITESKGHGQFFFEKNTIERAKCLQWLTYVSTEMHQKIAPLFHKDVLSAEFKKQVSEKVDTRLQFLDRHLASNDFLVGGKYSIADMYALAIFRLCEHVDIDLSHYDSITRYKEMMEAKPCVAKVTEKEEAEAKSLKENSKPRGNNIAPVNLDEYTLSHH